MRLPSFRLLLALLVAPLAPAWAQETAPAAAQPAEITLLPGDLVKVQVYREPDLNGEFLVDENGVVVLPLVGERRVAGIPLSRLRTELTDAYRVHLRNPSIGIIPLRRVNVLREVQRPGQYTLDPTVSLAGAIAAAGGATSIGDLGRIRVIRGGATILKRVGAGETLSAVDVRSGDQIIVDRRSWFERNSTFLVSAMLSITGVVASLIVSN